VGWHGIAMEGSAYFGSGGRLMEKGQDPMDGARPCWVVVGGGRLSRMHIEPSDDGGEVNGMGDRLSGALEGKAVSENDD